MSELNKLVIKTKEFLSNLPIVQSPEKCRALLISSGFDDFGHYNLNMAPDELWTNLIWDHGELGKIDLIEKLLIEVKERVGNDRKETVESIIRDWRVYREQQHTKPSHEKYNSRQFFHVKKAMEYDT